jgi:hypothetical protein
MQGRVDKDIRVITVFISGLLLSACDLQSLTESGRQATTKAQLYHLSASVNQMRVDAQLLLEKDNTSMTEVNTQARVIGGILDEFEQATTDKSVVQAYKKQWQTISAHLRELNTREQKYQTFLRQRAVTSKNLAVLTNSLDKFALATMSDKVAPDLIYLATGVMFLNERMQHSLTLLLLRTGDGALSLDRFVRDARSMKVNLNEMHAMVSKDARLKSPGKPLLGQIESLRLEYNQTWPVIAELLGLAPEYLDFVERTEKLQELLAHMDESLNEKIRSYGKSHDADKSAAH